MQFHNDTIVFTLSNVSLFFSFIVDSCHKGNFGLITPQTKSEQAWNLVKYDLFVCELLRNRSNCNWEWLLWLFVKFWLLIYSPKGNLTTRSSNFAPQSAEISDWKLFMNKHNGKQKRRGCSLEVLKSWRKLTGGNCEPCAFRDQQVRHVDVCFAVCCPWQICLH